MADGEKPIHVRVAEALGTVAGKHWQDRDTDICLVCGADFNYPLAGARPVDPCAPRYDTDWAASGPLVERFGLDFYMFKLKRGGVADWQAERIEEGLAYTWAANGPTPLLAICNLILALHAAGKLEEVA